MTTVFDVDAQKLITKAAEALEKEPLVKAPSWAAFVKTGVHRERPPLQKNWRHIRCADELRSVYVQGPIGVAKLRKKYGGNKRRGVRPRHYRLGSGNILRKSLQQLQKAGFIEYKDKGLKKGRTMTSKGKKFLDTVARSVAQ